MPYSYKNKISRWDWYDAPSVTSTNDSIKELIDAKNQYIVLSAKRQTKGRGRRGNSWQEMEGNLYFTYSCEIALKDLSRYVCLTGLSLALAVKNLLPANKVEIKWPNDVFVEDKKISGILFENISNNLWAIGIGVNIKGAPKLAAGSYAATSLKELGADTDRTEFLKAYLEMFEDIITQYEHKGFAPLKEKWLSLAKNLNKEVSIKVENNLKTGIFLTLDDNGYLLLKTDNKTEQIIVGDLFTDKNRE